MTVKELINKLLDMPMDADIIIKQIHPDSEFRMGQNIQKIELNNSSNIVYLWRFELK